MEVKPGDNIQPRIPGDLDRRFATNGYIEISESGTANSITSDNDGNLILLSQIGDSFRLSRYLADGAKDDSFEETTWNFEDGDQSTPMRVLWQEDGKILVIGNSLKARAMRPAVSRFNPNGSPDLVFGRRVITSGPENTEPPIFRYKSVDGCLQNAQKTLIAARYTLLSGPLSRLFSLQADGEPDQLFGEGSGYIDIKFHDRDSYACDVQIQRNGSIIVAGIWRNDGEQQRTRTVARYTVEGILDNTFGQAGYADIVVPGEQGRGAHIEGLLWDDIVTRVAIQNDDKIIIAGYAYGPDGHQHGLLARLNPDGSMDEVFNKGKPLLISRLSNDLSLKSITIQPDGKIVAVGRGIMADEIMQLYGRVSQNGDLEAFWGDDSSGNCSDVTIQSGGRIVISGNSGTSIYGPHFPRVWGRLGT